MKNIFMTCAMPLYKSKRIAWLALESLCRQERVSFEWELIVLEEEDEEALGEQALRSYEKRLARVGCTAVRYASLKSWAALPIKWKIMGENARGRLFALVAGDNYINPNFMNETKIIAEAAPFDWIQTPEAYFYDIRSEAIGVFSHDLYLDGYAHPCAVDMVIKTELVKSLPADPLRLNRVDGWLFSQATAKKGSPLTIGLNKSESWRKGLYTDGANNISKSRGLRYTRESAEPPFRKPLNEEASDIYDIVPADIAQKLILLKDNLRFDVSPTTQGMITRELKKKS